MNTNRNQRVLLMATALVVVAGLLVIPAVAQHDANASKISDRLQKAHDKVQKSLDKIKERLNSHRTFRG